MMRKGQNSRKSFINSQDKTCVFIVGMNASGKSTLARNLINLFGGIKNQGKFITTCENETVCFAGRYSAESKYGGVDVFSQTKILESVVKEGLRESEIIICEGSYLNTFGMNLTNAMFVAQKHLIVFLYLPAIEIQRRLIVRSGKGMSLDVIVRKQKQQISAIKKWKSIGVPVLAIDSSLTCCDDISRMVFERICLL